MHINLKVIIGDDDIGTYVPALGKTDDIYNYVLTGDNWDSYLYTCIVRISVFRLLAALQ